MQSKEEKAAYQKDYYNAHREKKLARQRAYYAAHPASPEKKAKISAYHKAHYAANREKILARQAAYSAVPEVKERNKLYAKKYWATHRDYYRALNRAYHIAHREEDRAKAKVYHATHLEENKIYRKKHRAARRAYELQKSYGLSKEKFDALITAQGGGCATCGKADWGPRGPVVDHDHLTGKVRGVLCSNCNKALGFIKDDSKIVKAMGDYLKKFSGKGKK